MKHINTATILARMFISKFIVYSYLCSDGQKNFLDGEFESSIQEVIDIVTKAASSSIFLEYCGVLLWYLSTSLEYDGAVFCYQRPGRKVLKRSRKFKKDNFNSNQIFYTHKNFLHFGIFYISRTYAYNKKIQKFYISFMDQPGVVNKQFLQYLNILYFFLYFME